MKDQSQSREVVGSVLMGVVVALMVVAAFDGLTALQAGSFIQTVLSWPADTPARQGVVLAGLTGAVGGLFKQKGYVEKLRELLK